MQKYPLIRTIYLYVFALLGLVLVTIGTVRFVNMALKTFVFTQADQDQRYMYEPPMPPYAVPVKGEKISNNTSTAVFTEAEQEDQRRWMAAYKDWQERRSKIDYQAVRRHQDASMNLALILVGLPLYLYHWRVIQKETKDIA
ncbi:hypothetical protein HY621_01265 [Candidatus Uhrbacteria bacterium]|nr:hypothetical protein [Candidatus Uhrbacteria bacterium]